MDEEIIRPGDLEVEWGDAPLSEIFKRRGWAHSNTTTNTNTPNTATKRKSMANDYADLLRREKIRRSTTGGAALSSPTPLRPATAAVAAASERRLALAEARIAAATAATEPAPRTAATPAVAAAGEGRLTLAEVRAAAASPAAAAAAAAATYPPTNPDKLNEEQPPNVIVDDDDDDDVIQDSQSLFWEFLSVTG